MSQPLHFGDYGGLALKLLWALLDVLAIVVLGSGLYLWLRKPKSAAQSNPGSLGLSVEPASLATRTTRSRT